MKKTYLIAMLIPMMSLASIATAGTTKTNASEKSAKQSSTTKSRGLVDQAVGKVQAYVEGKTPKPTSRPTPQCNAARG